MLNEGTFEGGYFWEAYRDLEKQVIQYFDYLPYLDGNEDSYSYRLSNILTSIGGYIDSSFKEIERDPDYTSLFEKKYKEIEIENERLKNEGKKQKHFGFSNYLETIDEIYTVSNKEIFFKKIPERIPLRPFQNKDFWKKYNGVKHDWGRNLREASLKNVVNTLGGLFLINALHKPSMLRLYDYNLFTCCHDKKPLHQFVTEIYPRQIFLMDYDQGTLEIMLETDMFIYYYYDPKKVKTIK